VNTPAHKWATFSKQCHSPPQHHLQIMSPQVINALTALSDAVLKQDLAISD